MLSECKCSAVSGTNKGCAATRRVAHQELLKLGRDREGDEGLGELEGGGGGGRAETGKAVKELSVRGEGGRKGREDEGEEDYIPLVIGQCTGGFEDDVGATCRRPPPLTYVSDPGSQSRQAGSR